MAPIQFGILMIPYQTTDVAGPTDILSCSSKSLFTSALAAGLVSDATLPSRGIDIEFHHISTSLDPVELSSGFKVLPSTTVATCPELDYLLVGGPDITTFKLDPAFAKLVQEHVAKGRGLFTTCTGAAAIASSGVLDGRKATTNFECLDFAKKAFPKVEWVKEQWVVDGKIWTSGGACAGMDMFAHWVAENYDADIAAVGKAMLDFKPRDINGKMIEG